MRAAVEVEALRPAMTPCRRAQAWLVDLVKRRALRSLHATSRGEALLLEAYLWAEEGAEGAILDDLRSAALPPWLANQVARHADDEARHASLLRDRLSELGGARGLPVDRLSRWKLRALERIVLGSACGFREGQKVPLFAVAFRMEAMGVRVLERHLEVCATLEARAGKALATRAVLAGIAADERRHVLACERTLLGLVDAAELPLLVEILHRIDKVERAFGISSSIALWVSGGYFQVLRAAQRLGDRSARRVAS